MNTTDLTAAVRRRLVDTGDPATPIGLADAVRAEGRAVGTQQAFVMLAALRAEFRGAGPLQELLQRPGITDVLVNGWRQVWVDDGDGLRRIASPFQDEDQVRRLAQRLAAAAGRRLDDSSPFCDARLPDGTRFHACLAPIARPGHTISLRIPSPAPLTLGDLTRLGALTTDGVDWLRALIRSRESFLVSGGTGTGKTTVLGALLGTLPDDERVVILEDSAELTPDHLHTCGLEGRAANVEGSGHIRLADLVRQSLRMRPDRIVVGEVRGGEVVDLLNAMNTGHEGCMGTVHASSAERVTARLEALATAGGLGREAAHAQIAGALDAIVHLDRKEGRRRVVCIAGLERTSDGLVTARTAIDLTEPTRVLWDGPLTRRLREHR